MKDINKRLQKITKRAKRKVFRKIIRSIIRGINYYAKRGSDYVEYNFCFFNIGEEVIKETIVEELHNRGYNATLLKDEDAFRVDWSVK